MPAITRVTNLDATVGGTNIANAYGARVSLGYDMSYGTCSVDVAGDFPGGNFFDDLNIFVLGEHWFSGILTQVDYRLYPKSVTLQGKGRLWFLDKTRPPDDVDPQEGLFLEDFAGAPAASDETIVAAVLGIAGLDTNGGSIGGTGRIMGTIAPEEWAWKPKESALSYVQRIDQVSAGYRTFESTGGSIFRSQVSTFPDGGADMTFQEGVDISEATNSRSYQESYQAVRVSGYAIGDFFEPRVWIAGSGSNIFTFQSGMIERRAEASEGEGMSCETMANYWLNELDRVLVKLQMTTPRNDNIGPGQVHNIQAGDRLGQSGSLWVQRVDKEYSPDGSIKQTMTYIGAG